MTAVAYVWKGTVGDESNAQAVGERLAEIEQSVGFIKPEAVVDDAKSENSVLHKYFEWDDSVAAVQHRLQQARQLISRVHIKTVDAQEVRQPVRAFINIRNDEEQSYESTVSAMSDDLKRTIILRKAKSELLSWRQRYDHLNEFAKIFSVISEVA